MKIGLIKRFSAILLALSVTIGLVISNATDAQALYSEDVTLNVPWTLINNCGNQYEGHKLGCQAYSFAYCRIILDNQAHIWTDYRVKNSPYLAVSFAEAGYNNEHSLSKQEVLKAVYDNINSGRPVVLNVVSQYTSGHYVVAIGYKASCNPNAIKESDIIIIDPTNRSITSTSGAKENYTNLGTTYSLKCNTNNHNLYQYGTAKSGGVAIKDIGTTYTVTFDPNGGSVSQTSKVVTPDQKYGTLPVPSRNGYIFDGWFTPEGTRVIAATTVKLTGNQTLYAHWTEERTYTVTFDPNGGNVSTSSKKVTDGSLYGTLPTPTRSGYTFDDWYTSPTGGVRMTSNTIANLTSDQTLYAHWTQHTHTNGAYFYSDSHPHYKFYTCTTCGEVYTDGSTTDMSSCSTCNPPKETTNSKHTHTDGSYFYSDSHPHYKFYACVTCGEVYTDGSTTNMSSCSTCNPPTWSSWSNWSTNSVSASSTREVETRQVKISDAYTEYRYGLWRNANNASWCPNYGASLSSSGGSWYEAYSNWSTTRMYRDTGHNAFCSGSNHNHTHVSSYDSSGRANWDIYSDDGTFTGWGRLYYYWEETRTIPAVYETQYRYRDLIPA